MPSWPVAGGTVRDVLTERNLRDLRRRGGEADHLLARGFNIESFGARADAADNSGAVKKAKEALGETGGTVVFPAKTFKFTQPLNFDDTRSVRLVGFGGLTAGNAPATQLLFTQSGTEAPISARSTAGFGMADLGVYYSNSELTGSLVDLTHSAKAQDSAYGTFERCQFAGQSIRTANGFNLDKAIVMAFRDCYFQNLKVACIGQKEAGSYSNSIRMDGCTFTGMGTSPLKNAGDAWYISACTFDAPMFGGAAGAYSQDAGIAFPRATTFTGCWMGDVAETAPASTWINWKGNGLTVTGNLIGGSLGKETIFGINVQAESTAIHISANRFVSVTRPITLAATAKRYIIGANEVSSATGKKVSVDGGATDAGEGFLSN